MQLFYQSQKITVHSIPAHPLHYKHRESVPGGQIHVSRHQVQIHEGDRERTFDKNWNHDRIVLERMCSITNISKIFSWSSGKGIMQIGIIENPRYLSMTSEVTARPRWNIHSHALSTMFCRSSESTWIVLRRRSSAFVPKSRTFPLTHVQSGHKQLPRNLIVARIIL